MIRNFILFVLLIFGIIVFDVSTIALLIFAYIIGSAIVRQVNFPPYRADSIAIYQILFIVGFAYILICYHYMILKNYDFLLAFDTYNYFLPGTESHLRAGSYTAILTSIWKNYEFLQRNIVGYFTYSTFWGYFSKIINANLYVSLQVSSLFISSFIGVVLYRLFIKNDVAQKNSYNYAVIISLISILFFYSTQILRDSHIALFYLCAIYITFQKFSFHNLILLFILIILIWTFRLESGLFSIIFIPLYLILSLESSKAKNYIIAAVLIVFLAGFSVIIFQNINKIVFIVEANREAYAEGIEDTGGIIAMLQSLPSPAAELLSIFYNAIQPIPFWVKMMSDYNPSRPESYNIMTFPLIFSAFFNWITICYLSLFLFSKEIRNWTNQNISRPLKYNLFIGTVFLFLQSEVMTQRRIMAFYCIFYILAFLIFSQINEEERRKINFAALTSYALLQILAVLYLK